MKQLFLILIFFITSLFSSGDLNLTQEEKDYIKNNPSLKIGVYPVTPYMYDVNGTPSGYYIDLTKEIFSKINIIPIFTDVKPLKENLELFKTGQTDISLSLIATDERKKYMDFANIFLELQLGIYANKDNREILNEDSIDGKTIASYHGYALNPYFKKKFPNSKIIYGNTAEDMFRFLALGKADLLIQETQSAKHTILKSHFIDIERKSFVQRKIDIGLFVVQKNNHILKSILEKSYNTISSSKFALLREKWFASLQRTNENLNLKEDEKKFLQNNKFNVYIDNWEPFSILDKNKPKPFDIEGISIDIWEEIAKQANIQFHYIPVKKSDDILTKIQEDPKGVALYTTQTSEKKDIATATKLYNSFAVGVATLENQTFKISMNEFYGKTIAVKKDSKAYKVLEKDYPYIKIKATNNTLEALDLVSKGVVDGAAEILPVLSYSIYKYQYKNIKINAIFPQVHNFQIVSNIQSSKLIDIVNKVLENLEVDFVQKTNNKWLSIKEINKGVDIRYILYGIIIILIAITFYYINVQKKLKQLYNKLNETNKQLKKEHERFDIAVEGSQNGIVDWNMETNELYYSPKWKEIIGYKDNELPNKAETWRNLVHPDDIDNTKRIFKEYISNPAGTFEATYRMKHKDGSYRWINSRGKASVNAQGKPNRMIWFTTDITELIDYRIELEKKVKEQLEVIREKDLKMLEQAKIASIGEMMSNIAHQWRQPLNLISLCSSNIKIHFEMDDIDEKQFISDIDHILDSCEYLTKIIDTFSNYLNINKKIENNIIENEINSAKYIIEASLKAHLIKLIDDIDYSKVHICYMVENELSQVIMNIINNAKDALVENKKTDDKWIKIAASEEDDKFIITIEDNGGGIPENIIDRVFEPYFTTKFKSQGTGLGLSMSYNIIKDSIKGDIYVKNSENGAKFFIELPIQR